MYTCSKNVLKADINVYNYNALRIKYINSIYLDCMFITRYFKTNKNVRTKNSEVTNDLCLMT